MVVAVWLVPSEPESALLQQLMSRHPEPSAPCSFPHFHPHITLASACISARLSPPPIESSSPPCAWDDSAWMTDEPDPTVLLALREAVPLGQRAVHVRFARVLAGDHYFRSIYVAVAPSPELARLRTALGQALEERSPGPDAPPAFPHLSLYYIADEEAHTRARFSQELERENVVRHSADGLSVALRCAGGGDGDGDGVLKGFTGTQIWIVECEGPVEGWKVLDKILLAK